MHDTEITSFILPVIMIAVGLAFMGFAKAFSEYYQQPLTKLLFGSNAEAASRFMWMTIGTCIMAAGFYFLCRAIWYP
jgi:hypothetical protein